MRLNLGIRIESIDFDTEQCSLRVKGRNVYELEHIKLGQYHTMTIEVGYPIQIEKDCWDAIYLQRLEESVNVERNADVVAIVMHEGLCHICMITPSMSITKARIEKKFPHKKQTSTIGNAIGTKIRQRALDNFFNEIYFVLSNSLDYSMIKAIIIGSPGFLKDDFYKYMIDRATQEDKSLLIKNKHKFVTTHVTSGHKKALDEIYENKNLHDQLADVKAVAEMRALSAFHSMLTKDEYRACYGKDHVLLANEYTAIQSLLITDQLFKAPDPIVRAMYVKLSESVAERGGEVHIFSVMHGSGKQLEMYTGIAAILRFPVQLDEADDIVANVKYHEETIFNPSNNNNDNHNNNDNSNSIVDSKDDEYWSDTDSET